MDLRFLRSGMLWVCRVLARSEPSIKRTRCPAIPVHAQLPFIRNSSKTEDIAVNGGETASAEALGPIDLGEFNLPADAVAHGREQVKQMLADRSAMQTCPNGAHVTEADIVWRWAARKFAGEDSGFRIFWQSTPPKVADATAESDFPMRDGATAFIRIHEAYWKHLFKKVKLPFEELWFSAVFELFNQTTTPHYRQLYEKALNQEISKDQWITANTRLEYRALQRSRDFYKLIWEPWAKRKGFQPSTAIWWVRYLQPSYKGWISQYADRSKYPWDFWGSYYDEIVLYLLQTDQYVEPKKGKSRRWNLPNQTE